MADDIDLAQDREQFLLDAQIRARKPAQAPTGFCLNCDVHLETGVYCDADCREDGERRDKLQAYASR